ncbi:NUDIX domain-containing protein [Polymorphospora sp. NPDC050346]|uniref:NUDIX hydrolase n=1 Tax=Polymorphospora sp. NPDC050346 TaxID=3155780 RepID=UPI0033C717A9
MIPRAYGPDARFCPRCAAALPTAPPGGCDGCGYQLFVNARPTASLIVLDGDRFLALRRAAEPRSGRWETPGGFCDGAEHPAAAAVREGREELGVEVTLGDFVGMYVGSYDYQGETLPVLDCFYLASIRDGAVTLDPAESSELAWFDLYAPPELAFPTMDAAIRDVARIAR